MYASHDAGGGICGVLTGFGLRAAGFRMLGVGSRAVLKHRAG